MYSYFYFHKPQISKVTVSPLRYFSYNYISYQMYVTWSGVWFYHLWTDFQRQMTTVLVLPENIFNIEVYSKSTSFILNWTYLNFLNFHGRHPCKKKEVRINYFEEQKKPRIFFKIFQKTKISKPFAPFWTIQNLKFSLSTNHGCRHFFKSLRTWKIKNS